VAVAVRITGGMLVTPRSPVALSVRAVASDAHAVSVYVPGRKPASTVVAPIYRNPPATAPE